MNSELKPPPTESRASREDAPEVRLSPGRLLLLGTALVLALAIVVLGGVSALHRVESFQPLGFTAVRAEGGWSVTAVEAPETGLRAGDLILFGEASVSEVASRLRDESSTELAVLRVVQGESIGEGAAEGSGSAVGGPELVPEVVGVTYRRPGLDIDWTYLLLAASGVLYLLIGLYTALRSLRIAGFLFALWCLASAAVYLLSPTGSVSGLFDRAILGVEDLARLLLPPLTLHLFLVFPRPANAGTEVLGSARYRYVPFLYLPAVALAVLKLDWMLLGGALVGVPSDAALLLLDRLELVLFGVYVVGALLVLVGRWSREERLEERQQLRWMTVGVGGGFLPFLLLYVAPLALALEPPQVVTAVAVAPLALVPLTFAYAILRYKLWDIGIVVRNTIASTLTVFLGILGFALFNLMVSRGLPEEMAQARTAASFVAGLVIAGLMVPARRGIGSSLERLHHGRGYGRRQALTELGRELLHERELDPLCAGLLEHLEVGLQLGEVNLYLAQPRGLVSVRPRPEVPPILPVDLLDEEDWWDDVTAISGLSVPGQEGGAMQALFRAGYRYIFPLTVRESRVGALVSSYKLGEKPLDSEDLELVRGMLNQAALALENARLLEEQKDQLEEVLRLKRYNEGIIQSSQAGIAVFGGEDDPRSEDSRGRVISANLAFAALVGRERPAILGRPIEEVLPVGLPEPEDGLCEASYRPGYRADSRGGARKADEERAPERYLQLSVSRLDGDERRQILMVHDVTERVNIEQELKEKDRLASLGMLAAGVAHEVNTPITGISSYAQMLLADTPEDDPRHGMLRKMERQTFRAARIVASLLDFARNRQGEHRPINLARALGAAVEESAERAREQGVEVVWKCPEAERSAGAALAAASRDGGDADAVEAARPSPWRVVGSETELTQVFVNLVGNALDAMAGGGTLTLHLEAGDDRVWAAVEDTGTGISPEALEKVFQPFFSTKLTQGGTGLGLSISYEIVRRHGGQMRVVSQVGEGSRFVVELPRCPQAVRRGPLGEAKRTAAGFDVAGATGDAEEERREAAG